MVEVGCTRYWPVLAAGGVADERDGAGASARALVRSAREVCVLRSSCIPVRLLYLTGVLLLVAGSENTGIWQ